MEHISEFIPPELAAQLYVDCGGDNEIRADLMFCYDNDTFNAFSGEKSPHYDISGENAAKTAVLKSFETDHGARHHTLFIRSDGAVYEFAVNGVNELSRMMELYVSEKFRRIAVRPPVKPRIGVRVSGGLLELDIGDDNYTASELAGSLTAYCAKAKYHRLKDG